MKTLRYLIPAMALLGIAIFLTNYESAPSPRATSPTSQRADDHPAQRSKTAVPATPDSSSSGWSGPDTPPSSVDAAASPSVTTSSPTSLNDLPSSEQQSLWKAFSEARREVRPIPESRAQRAENLGYDFYALHPKQNMTTRFGSQGVQIVSSDRHYTEADAEHPTTAWQAQMHLLSFAGERVPQGSQAEKSSLATSRVEYRHGPVLTEWFDNGIAGIEHGYTIATRPPQLSDGEEVALGLSDELL